jgi:hypothetical protein
VLDEIKDVTALGALATIPNLLADVHGEAIGPATRRAWSDQLSSGAPKPMAPTR